MSTAAQETKPKVARSLETLIDRALELSGMTYPTFVRSVTQNAFGSLTAWSEADLERLLLACESLGLSPVGRDMYAVSQDGQKSLAVIALGIDGWARIINAHPAFDGLEFNESHGLVDGVPEWISCSIYRRDRRVALTVKEYLSECRRDTSAWQTHPRRMLRHKALVHCARLAFDLPTSLGVYEPDEAERVSLTHKGKPEGASKPMHYAQASAAQVASGQVSGNDSSICPAVGDKCGSQVVINKGSRKSKTEELVGTLSGRQQKRA